MTSILNYLKNVCKTALNGFAKNPTELFFALLLATIPLSLAINNVFLILFLLLAIITKNRTNNIFHKAMWFPFLFFIWMCLSFFWSIDPEKTIKAIPKEIALLVLPVGFLLAKFNQNTKQKVIQFYSYAMLFFSVFYVFRAVIRFVIYNNTQVFFYHGEYFNDSGLVPKSLNAIHVSVMAALAYFYFLSSEKTKNTTKYILLVLFGFILLLSSKNIIIIFIVLNIVYFTFYSKVAHKLRLRNLLLVLGFAAVLLSVSNIKNRFLEEFQSNSEKTISNNVINGLPNTVNVLSSYQAWHNESFTPNDFFPGTSFRVYQARLFFEFLQEEPIFLKGFGLNASYKKIEEKGIHYNVFLGNNEIEGYQKKNFHNQYFQTFAELGIIGFLLLLLMLVVSLKKAIHDKDFIHISFTILMISLFLTESFLWRQRGVVFFTAFYCLFMMMQLKPNINE